MNKTKRKIFETSMKLFAEKGYDATSIEEITATVGVAKGTLYYHFSSKEEIFNFLVEEGIKLLDSIKVWAEKEGLLEGLTEFMGSRLDEYKIEVLNKLLKDDGIREKVGDEYKEIINTEQEEKEKYFCNKGLQNGIAVGMCIIIALCLIVGVNFNLIAEGSTATRSQFRDIISGCIGFLLGNNNR